jgi:hypothetical protein
MALPSEGKFYLLAHVIREMPAGSEEFTWLVPISNETKQRVTLANNNHILADEPLKLGR